MADIENSRTKNTTYIDDINYKNWIMSVEKSRVQHLIAASSHSAKDLSSPLISIVMPVYNTPGKYLSEAIDSVLNQHYSNWELCIADDASTDSYISSLLKKHAEDDPRIKLYFRDHNGGISKNSNDALSLAAGEYIAFMDHDDVLAAHALLCVSNDLCADPGIKILYSDSDSLDEDGNRCRPFFKPDWNYELLLGQNYLNHLTVYKSSLLVEIGGFRDEMNGAQDYDLLLRAIEKVEHGDIKHIPDILYHWRTVKSSVSQTNMKLAVAAGRQAIDQHLLRSDQRAKVKAAKNAIIYNAIDWQLPSVAPRVAIIIYDCQQSLHGNEKTLVSTYPGAVDIIYVMAEEDPLAAGALPAGNAGLARHLNDVASRLTHTVLCFIHSSLIEDSDDWLSIMVAQVLRRGVGLCAPKILSFDGHLLGSPMILGLQTATGVDCIDSGSPELNKGYFARLMLDQNASALHGACLLVKNTDFKRAGGFDPALSHLALIGADLSLRLESLGLSSVWSARAVFRGDEHVFKIVPADREAQHFSANWNTRERHESNYNDNFINTSACFELP